MLCLQGRKSVRYGDFQFCEQAKSVIVVSENLEENLKMSPVGHLVSDTDL